MRFSILTLFPDYFSSQFKTSLIGGAAKEQKIYITLVNIRDFTHDKYRMVDDRPFGGGPGMVMKVEPIARAVASVRSTKSTEKEKVVLLSARGNSFTQATARHYSSLDHLILICGHYSDVDQRVADHIADEELRVGEAVLTGGEPAAALVLDAVSRLLPGVIGNDANLDKESLDESGILASAPAYTRPAEFQGWKVPEVLLTGNHKEIEEWKSKQQKNSEKN